MLTGEPVTMPSDKKHHVDFQRRVSIRASIGWERGSIRVSQCSVHEYRDERETSTG